MTREIKFRALYQGEIKNWSFVKYYLSAMIDDKGVELMQYTGLKDKNGKEIYEGDIVKYSDGVCLPYSLPITFERGEFTFSLVPEGCLEVIGNIYENPELLEEEE